MKTILLAGAAAVGLLAGTQGAQAALSLSGDNMTAGVIPGFEETNNALTPLGFGTPLRGYYAAQVFTTAPGTLTFELLGWEAQRQNTFSFTGAPPQSLSSRDGTSGWATPLASAVSSFSRDVGTGLVPFSFTSTFRLNNNESPTVRTVANGSNPLESNPEDSTGQNGRPNGPNTPVVNFFSTFGQPSAGNPGATDTSGNVLYLFFDDRGFSRLRLSTPNPNDRIPDDDNHDDLVVKISFKAAPVPEPATLGLLGAGLLGLGFAAGRRRKA